MDAKLEHIYNHIRSGKAGYYEQKRGLISVSGKEAVQFLDGMVTADLKTIEDGREAIAAFPNAQGRLLAVIRIKRLGGNFLIDTEESTREKVFSNLFRFTFAGDFFVEDVSENFGYFELFNCPTTLFSTLGMSFVSTASIGSFQELPDITAFRDELAAGGAAVIDHDLYDIIRIESGVPRYGIDMDETTIVPELGIDGLISYNKGCYIGQEIIARIHFRGHVAKRLTGLFLTAVVEPGTELTIDGKNAGRITSSVYSPKLERAIALAYVRYDHLSEGTELMAGTEAALVTSLPFL